MRHFMKTSLVVGLVSVVFGTPAFAQDVAGATQAVVDGTPVDPRLDTGNWRKIVPENLLHFLVNGDDILIELRPDVAPKHVEQIRTIVRNGHYDGLPFHRVIDDFMAQGGEVASVYDLPEPYASLEPEFTFRRDPLGQPLAIISHPTGNDVVGYADGLVVRSQAESIAPLMEDKSVDTWLMHCPGIASMARADAPNSADTQFFLMRQSQPQLDKNYTPWGRVVLGLDVVRGIKAGPSETDGRLPPDQADRLMHAEIVSDLPTIDQPVVYVQRTEGPNFKAHLEQLTEGGVRDPCSLPPVPVIVENLNRG